MLLSCSQTWSHTTKNNNNNKKRFISHYRTTQYFWKNSSFCLKDNIEKVLYKAYTICIKILYKACTRKTWKKNFKYNRIFLEPKSLSRIWGASNYLDSIKIFPKPTFRVWILDLIHPTSMKCSATVNMESFTELYIDSKTFFVWLLSVKYIWARLKKLNKSQH